MAKQGFFACYDKPGRRHDVSKDGFGSPRQWGSAFRVRMSLDEAEAIVDKDSPFTILGIATTFKWIDVVLGKVRPNIAWPEIKTAYRRMATKWHPDVCREPDAEAQMKRINAAFTILEDRYSK